MRSRLLDLLEAAVALWREAERAGTTPGRRAGISPTDAATILDAYDDGALTDDAVRRLLPLATREAVLSVSEDALGTALYRLHLLLGFTAAQAEAAALGGIVRVVETGRLSALVRVTAGYGERAAAVTRQLAEGGDVSAWQRSLGGEIRSEILGSSMLGTGREPLPSEVARIQAVLDSEAAYLSRFADEVASRRALAEATGDPSRAMSEKAIRARANTYAGAARAEFFRGIESRRGDGFVVDYEARDDEGTCPPCLDAERGGPYLPNQGPYPGTVCRARGACRCRRVVRFDPAAFARLRADSGPTRRAA